MSLLFSPTNWANPGQIGSTTPNTGVFSAVSATSFTHNGSPYFRQQAQPSSPTAGTRWDELDGSGLLVNQWEWLPSVNGGSWATVQLFTKHFNSSPDQMITTLSGGSQLVLGSSFAPPHPFGGIWINNVTFSRFAVSSGLDATNNYQQLIQVVPSQNLTVASLTINSNDPVGSGYQHVSVAANSFVVRTFLSYGDLIRYAVRGNGTPPTNFTHFASLNYRGIR